MTAAARSPPGQGRVSGWETHHGVAARTSVLTVQLGGLPVSRDSAEIGAQERPRASTAARPQLRTCFFQNDPLRAHHLRDRMGQLGGHLAPGDIGRERESVKDVAATGAGSIQLRRASLRPAPTATFELAREATVPVINGLVTVSHPVSFLLPFVRRRLSSECFASGVRRRWVQSWIQAAALTGLDLRVACPAAAISRRRVSVAPRNWI